MPADNPIPLYLFAKAPIAGQVKTRMQPALSGESCAALARWMLEQSVARVAEYWPGPKLLCVTPDLRHPLFHQLSAKFGFTLLQQVDGDLGGRMLAALQHGLNDYNQALVMGCDVPQIGGDVLTEAWQRMQSANNVIGPAEDGGFYLLGVDQLPVAAFEKISWGGNQVREQVLEQGLRQGLQFHLLPMLRDIDLVEDLVWLVESQAGYRSPIPQAVLTALPTPRLAPCNG